MPVIKITQREVSKIQPTGPDGNQVYYYDSDLKGFGLRVSRTRMTFFAEGKIGRKTIRVTIGDASVVSPQKARSDALALLADLSRGIDPRAENRDQELESLTLKTIYDEYVRVRTARGKLKSRTIKDYNDVLRLYIPDWQDKPIVDITKDLVEQRHAHITARSPSKANLTMRLIRALANFAMDKTLSSGRPLLLENPVRRMTRQGLWNEIHRRTNFIETVQLKTWWAAVQTLPKDCETTRDFLIMLLLTGLRRENAESLKWEHVDFQKATIHIPDPKGRKPFTLPLSDYLINLLKNRKLVTGKSPWVFPGDGDSGHLVEPKRAIMLVRGKTGINFTCHDLRRTFTSIGERIGIGPYTLKRLLDHKLKSDVTFEYAQVSLDDMRAAMQGITDNVIATISKKAEEEK